MSERRLFGSLHKVHRLEALSDGVFAIALTLLIIDVVAAAKDIEQDRTLGEHLIHIWPTHVSYLIGFLTVLVCWINHQRVFHYVKTADSGLVWINGLQLALVSAVPFPTALLAEHIDSDNRQTAVFLYGVTFFLMATSFALLWRYVHRRGLTDPTDGPEHYGGMGRIYGWAVLWTILAIIVAAFAVYLALAMWVVMFAVFAFPAEFARRARSADA